MKEFYVFKESGTFSDTLECLGFTSILQKVFNKIDLMYTPEIVIEDKGGCFQITCDKDINEDDLKKCEYFDFIPYIANKKDKKEELEFKYIDYEKEKEIRDVAAKNKKDKTIPQTRVDFDIIRTFANIGERTGNKKVFENCRKWVKHFDVLLTFLFRYYSTDQKKRDIIVSELDKFARDNELSIHLVSSYQDINPDKGKGVNSPKANSIKLGGVKILWFTQVLRFTGAWECLITKYFDKDFKTYALVPNIIGYHYLSSVFESLKPLVKGNESIKIDIQLIQLTIIELIKHNEKYKKEWSFGTVNDKIAGFQFAYYKNLGNKPAVTNIGVLSLPNFVKFNSEKEGNDWIILWQEHKRIIDNIDEGNSSHISMLQNYRQFLSASDLNSFFEFQFEYASFLMAAKNSSSNRNSKYINPFNLNNLEVLMTTSEKYSEIIKNAGFISIASAIRNSTIIPIIFKEKKDVIFGLNQKIKIASRTKDSLLTEVSEFIQKYNETMMLKDFHNKKHKKYVTTEEYEEFCKLFDKDYSSKLIAGLLVAYGYAKGPSKETVVEENNNNQTIDGEENE